MLNPITHKLLEEASLRLTRDDVSNAVFNLTDAIATLSKKELNKKVDQSDSTVRDLLDDVMLFLEQLENRFIA